MLKRLSVIGAVLIACSSSFSTAVWADADGQDLPTVKRQLPQYSQDGQLLLPKNFHQWIYVGSPLTPNALNGGKANFPEYHNVYIAPGSYAI